MIKTIQHNGIEYPHFQCEGNAAQFCRPFAQKVCKGVGYDIGGNRAQWGYVDVDDNKAMIIDPLYSKEYDAYNLPNIKVDYIHSSHCLEHLPDWVAAIDYWKTNLHKGGVLFLYLPDYSQTYWRVWHNRKHIHSFTPNILRDYLTDRGWKNIFVSAVDLNNSFMVMAEN
jgi:predicted SAM-dependent methyltransferase